MSNTAFLLADDELRSLSMFSPIIKVTSHAGSTVFVTKYKQVYVLGNNERQQLGFADKQILIPQLIPIQNVVDATINELKTLLVTENNDLFAMGNYSYMALGFKPTDLLGQAEPRLVPPDRYANEKILFVAPAFSFSCVVTDKSLFVMGQNWFNPMNSRMTVSERYSIDNVFQSGKIIDVQCGFFHIGILTDSGEVFTGGDQVSGKLGRDQPRKILGVDKVPQNNEFFTCIAIGRDFSLFGTRSGAIYACGQLHADVVSLSVITSLTSPIKHLHSDQDSFIATSEYNQIMSYNFKDKEQCMIDHHVPSSSNVYAFPNKKDIYICLLVKHSNTEWNFKMLKRALNTQILVDVELIIPN